MIQIEVTEALLKITEFLYKIVIALLVSYFLYRIFNIVEWRYKKAVNKKEKNGSTNTIVIQEERVSSNEIQKNEFGIKREDLEN